MTEGKGGDLDIGLLSYHCERADNLKVHMNNPIIEKYLAYAIFIAIKVSTIIADSTTQYNLQKFQGCGYIVPQQNNDKS